MLSNIASAYPEAVLEFTSGKIVRFSVQLMHCLHMQEYHGRLCSTATSKPEQDTSAFSRSKSRHSAHQLPEMMPHDTLVLARAPSADTIPNSPPTRCRITEWMLLKTLTMPVAPTVACVAVVYLLVVPNALTC